MCQGSQKHRYRSTRISEIRVDRYRFFRPSWYTIVLAELFSYHCLYFNFVFCFYSETTGDTTMKFAVLVDAMKNAEPHIKDDDDSSDRLLRALCRR